MSERLPFKFWDALNGTPENAIEARCPLEWDYPAGVAIALRNHAELEFDDHHDSVFTGGHPFIVEYPDGRRELWEVTGELEPTFYARKTDTEVPS